MGQANDTATPADRLSQWQALDDRARLRAGAAEVGRVAFQGRPSLEHYNPMGTVHGGWFATLLDSPLGCVVQSTLPAGKAYTTAELKINIVRPLGGRMATAEGRLTGPDGKLYAHGSTTCFILDTP